MMITYPSWLTLRRFNHVLTVIVIAFAIYIIAIPFLPALTWWVQHEAPVISKPPSIATSITGQNIPNDNTFQLPSIGLSQTIHEGPNKYTLHYGVWHRPGTGSPDAGGNTVLAGHRFTYHDPAVFYHLDKVAAGDPMIIYWQHHKYTYKVQQVLTVQPTDTAIENPTDKPTLTVYTCTPLWTSKYRLALIGSLESKT